MIPLRDNARRELAAVDEVLAERAGIASTASTLGSAGSGAGLGWGTR